MKKIILGIATSAFLTSTLFSDMTRVERFHQQHKVKSQGVHSSIRYAPRQMRPVVYHDSFQQQRYIRPYQPQRYIQPVGNYRQSRPVYPRPLGYERRYQPSCAPVRQVVYRQEPVYRYRTGEVFERLPVGARSVYIDSRQYYQYDRYYFQPRRRNGATFYIVVNL